MSFERSNVKEKPLFRLIGKFFGVNAEVKTDNSSQPISLDVNCSGRKVDLGINKKFASLLAGEFVASFGLVKLERYGQSELASELRKKMLERRDNHEFGETLDKIDEVLEPLAECLRERMRLRELEKKRK